MSDLKIGAQMLTLCDAANVREGLLNVLSAGVTLIGRPSFPAAMEAQLAILLEIEGDVPSDGVPFRMSMVNRQSGKTIVPDLQFDIGGDTADASSYGLPATFPLALNLEELMIPKEGQYEVQLRVQEKLLGTLSFSAVISASR